MKVYISGKITGEDPGAVERKFAAAEAHIWATDNTPFNPLCNGLTPEHSWREHMLADIALLMECEAICLLPCWQESRGARIEAAIAREMGLKYFWHGDDDAQ